MDFNYRDDRIKLSLFEARETVGGDEQSAFWEGLYIPGSFK